MGCKVSVLADRSATRPKETTPVNPDVKPNLSVKDIAEEGPRGEAEARVHGSQAALAAEGHAHETGQGDKAASETVQKEAASETLHPEQQGTQAEAAQQAASETAQKEASSETLHPEQQGNQVEASQQERDSSNGQADTNSNQKLQDGPSTDLAAGSGSKEPALVHAMGDFAERFLAHKAPQQGQDTGRKPGWAGKGAKKGTRKVTLDNARQKAPQGKADSWTDPDTDHESPANKEDKPESEEESETKQEEPEEQAIPADAASHADTETAQVDSTETKEENESEEGEEVDFMAKMVRDVFSTDVDLQYQAVQKFRKMLSMQKNPPIDKVIEANVVPRIVELMQKSEASDLQYEAAWALTNIASGTSAHTKVVIDAGAVPIFASLLRSPREDVREQALWALGNIAGDSSECRDLVLGLNAMGPLLEQLAETSKISMLRNGTWTLRNLCKGKPQPDFNVVKAALPTLARLIHHTDEEIVSDACLALSYLSCGDDEQIDCVIEADPGVCKQMVDLLKHPKDSVVKAALRGVGDFVGGSEKATQAVVDCGALQCLHSLLKANSKANIRKESCFAISNITAGTQEQIQAVIDADLFPTLASTLLEEDDFAIKKEAAWAISNAVSGGNADQIRTLVSCDCIQALCKLLGATWDKSMLMLAFKALENIIQAGDEAGKMPDGSDGNPYVQQVKEGLRKQEEPWIEGSPSRIEKMLGHPDRVVNEKATQILEAYLDDTGKDQDAAPA